MAECTACKRETTKGYKHFKKFYCDDCYQAQQAREIREAIDQRPKSVDRWHKTRKTERE